MRLRDKTIFKIVHIDQEKDYSFSKQGLLTVQPVFYKGKPVDDIEYKCEYCDIEKIRKIVKRFKLGYGYITLGKNKKGNYIWLMNKIPRKRKKKKKELNKIFYKHILEDFYKEDIV